MASKTAGKGAPIAAPSGGGALRGIGEKFAPDLHTGTGNFSVPIALPPGRNGFQPSLTLSYSSGNGNGPLGLGWTLATPGISRGTSKRLPLYDDELDIFVLSGVEDLVPVTPPGGPSRQYRPRTEGAFARITRFHSATDDYWEVRSRDGQVSLYGTPGSAGNDPAVVADPADPAHVAQWRLTLTVDPFGNRIEYDHVRDPVRVRGPHRWDQLYLAEIRYVDYGATAAPDFLVKSRFRYGPRPDAHSSHRTGFEMRTEQRCVGIDIIVDDGGGEQVTRTYHLEYLDQLGVPASALPPNGLSLLARVRVEGRDGALREELPPFLFDYSRFGPGKRSFEPVTGSALPARSLGHPDLELVDLFGAGLPDLLEMNGTVRYWRNRGAGRFDLPLPMATAPAGISFKDPGVQLVDADGDGRHDLLVTTPTLAGYYPLRFGGLWDQFSFQAYPVAPSFDLEDPEVRLVDLDGDGVTDAIRASGPALDCFFNDPVTGWSGPRRVERQSLSEFPNVSFSDPRVRWADMSGDGLQDLVLIHDGSISYWPATGRGDWGRPIVMQKSPRYPDGYDPRRILLGDVDGDGVADLLYVEDTKVTLWIGQNGNGWSAPIEILGTPPVTDLDAIRLVDLHGGGVAGLLWSSDAGGFGPASMYFLDFLGGIKPYLLTLMDNSMGAVTRVGYAPSTKFYLADEQNAGTRWRTPLPFPVQVVELIEVLDRHSRGKLTSRFAYHHGYWDGEEREFRGFGRVDRLDSEEFVEFHGGGLGGDSSLFEDVPPHRYAPPNETRTWFHQGAIGDRYAGWSESDLSGEYWNGDPQVLVRPATSVALVKALSPRARRDALRTLRGRVLRTELYGRDGTAVASRPYQVTEECHAVETLPIGLALGAAPEPWQLRVFFPFQSARRVTLWERGAEPLTRLEFTTGHDGYGLVTGTLDAAVPRGMDAGVAWAGPERYLAKQTATTYAQRDDAQRFIVDRVARTTVRELHLDGSRILADWVTAAIAGIAPSTITSQLRNYYDGPEFIGLAEGQIGLYGAQVRGEALVLTPARAGEAWTAAGAAIPPWLAADPPVWTPEYPAAFRASVPPRGGFVYRPAGPGADDPEGWFAPTERRRLDIHVAQPNQRGLTLVTRDPLGIDSTLAYDGFDLLPAASTDAAGLTTSARYDYRVLQPREVTDPNGNVTTTAFTPLGLLASIAIKGKPGENAGDEGGPAGTSFSYHMAPAGGGPPFVHTRRRVWHHNDAAAPAAARNDLIESREFSDGFGRLLQTRSLAEDVLFGTDAFGDAGLPGDPALPVGDAIGRRAAAGMVHVTVSGTQLYDNKGLVVEKYEPWYSAGWDFALPGPLEHGAKATIEYDPLGRMTRTMNPNGSEQLALRGVPNTLATPEAYAPSPWVVYAYDANDNAGRTHPIAAASYQSHWDTPSSATIDALGRTVETVARRGPVPATDWLVTRSAYDINGNLLSVDDPLGRRTLQYCYDLSGAVLRLDRLDGGSKWTSHNAAGDPIEASDAKGALVLRSHDRLHRPSRLWARDTAADGVTLREALEYGDGGDPAQPGAERTAAQAANRLGRRWRQYDEAGRLLFETYDFKGNVLEKVRRVIDDAPLLQVFVNVAANPNVTPFQVDWSDPAGLEVRAAALVTPRDYRTSTAYDGVNRVVRLTYPQDSAGNRAVLQPTFDRAGALQSVTLDGVRQVEQVGYNAKGQRILLATGRVGGTGTLTRFAYDPKTFRLARLRSEPYTSPSPDRFHPVGTVLQDTSYEYDLAGSPLVLRDRAPGSGIAGTVLGVDALDRVLQYDPLYRLTSATGREADDPASAPPWLDPPRGSDPTKVRAYQETYQYDELGSLTRLSHAAGAGGFVRQLPTVAGSNRLDRLLAGADTFVYSYDPCGNTLTEGTARGYSWDHANRMRSFRTQPAGAIPSVHVQYLYDGSGQRVKKFVWKQGGQVETTTCLDGLSEERTLTTAGGTVRHTLQHAMDGDKRLLVRRIGNAFPGDASPAELLVLSDHLGGSSVTIEPNGAWVNREEYSPFGETTFGSFARKRYRNMGKEREEESALSYHGARYYAPWIGRWLGMDPAVSRDATHPFVFCRNSPLRYIDPGGAQAAEVSEAEAASQVCSPDLHAQQSPGGDSKPPWEQVAGGAGSGLAYASPKGYTLVVPDTYAPAKMSAYNQGVLQGEIGRNAGSGADSTSVRRSTPAQRAGQAEFLASEAGKARPAQAAPGGRGWAMDHVVELQHDLTGQKGTKAGDYRWQDSRANSTEGSRSWALNRNNPQGIAAGGVAKAASAGKWYHSEGFRTAGRGVGTGLTIYGAYKSTEHVADSIVADIEQGTMGAQSFEAVAEESAGWAGAMALGAKGAGLGAFCGPAAWICMPVGGLIGGGVGYYAGSTAARETIRVGRELTQ